MPGTSRCAAAHLDTHPRLFQRAQPLAPGAGLDDPALPQSSCCRPPVDVDADWRVATSLRPAGRARRWASAPTRREDYEDLIDHPVEMGRFDLIAFAVRGVPHRMAISGRHRCDEARLQQDLTRICDRAGGPLRRAARSTAISSWSRPWATATAGLEHRFSTSLLCSRDDLPRDPGPRPAAPSEGYRRFLGLCSHEYFHLWHVKRIRPQALMDGDLSARGPHPPAVGLRGHHLLLRRPGPGAQRLHRYRPAICSCWPRPSPGCCAPRGAWCRPWPSRASTPGPSSTRRTRTRPTPSSATTPRGPWWPWPWT